MTSTAWTYDGTLLSTSTAVANTMIVRRLVGDVLPGDPQVTDGEINFAISEYANLYLAGAEVSRWIAAQYSRKVDLVQGELKTNYSQQAKAYTARAVDLETRGMASGGLTAYAGGISQADKDNQVNDADRVPPQFVIGMTDDLLPVGPVGNETPGSPVRGGSNGS